ncbi:MAG TPA: PfkB family carbohydrate kinase [Gaiellales bacterium]|nr:PfkB family carbohydrate kinase [Gaiellales bacterium]
MPDAAGELEAVVMGRVCVDLYPMQLETPLEQVDGFHKYVGGFAGNVATGLARLGVRTAIVSAVGDDGHGRYVRAWLEEQGVDCRWLGVHPTLRTALAFCEAWPPDRFPITFYRTPTCPDWELTASSLDLQAIGRVPLGYVSGTGFAVEPSRLATQAVLEARAEAGGQTTVLDLDWREVLWPDPAEYALCMRAAARMAHAVLGSDEEIAAAVGGVHPERLMALGPEVVAQKHGPRGVTVHRRGGGSAAVEPHAVEVVNGLGAGDAFAAAFGWRLLRGDSPVDAAGWANRAGAHVAGRLGCSIAMPYQEDLQ